tara:strand:- start:1946 stop:2944 length:999 start_codon:yes stop_codon:yes gene_type:complete
MKTVPATFNKSFINQAHYDGVIEIAPEAVSTAKVTLDLDTKAFDAALEQAEYMVGYQDDENKLVAANIRRAGEGALGVLRKLERPAAPAAKVKKTKQAKPAPVTPADRPDPAVQADPTKVTYDTFTKAFDFFNAELFHGKLPPVMLVIHRKRNAAGYFWDGMWRNQIGEDLPDDAKVSEIALNPELMGRNPKEVLSTLVHEMVHHEQHVFGKPSKSGHNVEWCTWMERIDLTPRGVGNCAGKRSGRNFTHDIVEGGVFDKAATTFLARDDIDMSWFSMRAGGKGKKQDTSKVKHTCGCGSNIWGRHNPDTGEGINAICDDCGTAFEPVLYVK